MNRNITTRVCRLLKDERGQILPLMAIVMIGFCATAALSIDLGRAFYSYRELQSSSNAAALAGAQSLPNSTAAAAAATYSSVSGNLNAYSNLGTVTMVSGYPKLECLTALTAGGMACVAPANANAIQVKQQAVVPLIFAPIFGKKTLTLTATATAAMRGAASSPYNVAVVVDTTASMNSSDGDTTQCPGTRIACALSGVQVLLHDLYPCPASVLNCGTVTNSNVANSVDRVTLFTFPNATLGTVMKDYNCSGSAPTITPYTFPTAGASTYAPAGSTYQIVGYSSDYRTSDTTSTLSSTSNIVKSAGGASGCASMSAPGGEGTYYAGAIYAAQASLVAEKAANPGSQNVLIIISDGDASASSSAMTGASTSSGTYPSTKQQCHQAVTAAQVAKAEGTAVYSVSYGSAASGCSTDTSPTITPCQTMEQMASATQNFFSDYTQGGTSGTCISSSQPTTNINQIFTDIAGDLSVARLIPNGTT
jgi:Flp pilus assembly protein TadG